MAKKVTLDWTDPSPTTYVNQLEIWRKLDGGTYAHIGGAQLGDETYDDESSITSGAKYYYEVRAYNIDREYSVIENNITISTLLLDAYTGSEAAYSLRKLKTGISYAIEIRRDNDDATTGVQVYENGDSIDLSSIVSDGGGSLTAWVGSNNAYIKRWYDQSGNGNDLIQLTGAAQPQFINAGALYTINGFSAINGAVDRYLAALEVNGNVDLSNTTMFGVYTNNDTNSSNRPYGWGNVTIDASSSKEHVLPTADNSIRFDGASISGTIGAATGDYIRTTTKVSTTYNDWLNTSQNITNQVVTDGGIIDDFYINASHSQNNFNLVTEVVVWLADKTSNRTGIETEINNHYSIY